MRRYETEAEKAAKREMARKLIKETPPEKGDFLAMVIAAFIVLLPAFLIIVAIFILVMVLIFT